MAAAGLQIKADTNLQRDRSSIGTIDCIYPQNKFIITNLEDNIGYKFIITNLEDNILLSGLDREKKEILQSLKLFQSI